MSIEYLKKDDGVFINSQHELAKWFTLSLAICNECLVEIDKDGTLSYMSPSPDEIALCTAAGKFDTK